MIKDIVTNVEIFTKTTSPPEMQEKLMYKVSYRDGSSEEFTHDQWHEIVTRGSGALNQGSPTTV
jgi:hypothetical protein